MLSNHVVVWIDHVEAHVVHFNPEESESEVIKTHSTHPHLHVRAGQLGAGRAPENPRYFDEVAKAVKEALEILIVGPGQEKLELMKYFVNHFPLVARNVVSVETVDHPSDGQILAYARKYFVKADRMR
jgi:stalled ribosome rescue protein Dom34